MFNVRLDGGHLYGKQLFSWLSLVVSLMASFVLSFFPLDVLDEIWDLIESVSEGFLTYSLLGVTIDFQLNFDTHISNICKKASKQLNVLKRIGKYLCKLGKLNVYYSFVLSNFNYCPLTWHFCGEVNTKKIEKIQERALRFIYSDYSSSYESLLIKSQFPSLRVRRLGTMMLEAFKILNKQTPVYLHDLLTFKNNAYSFRYTNTVEIPQVRTTRYGTNSFRSMAATLWNCLPQHYRDAASFRQFRQVAAWSGGDCACSFCCES